MKSINDSRPMWFIALMFFIFSGNTLLAQTAVSNASQTDEQIIRNLVGQQNEGKNVIKFSDDRIFVSGAYPRAIIGKEMTPENQQAEDEMKKERQNFKAISRIQRVVVSAGGDMAYEFGFGDLSWDTPDKKHISFESTYLRVWRKLQGEWKVEVAFARPNPPLTPAKQ